MMTAEHFGEYAEELRQFSGCHGVPCGRPEDLHGLVTALGENETFAEECASMFRAAVYRERGEADAVSLLMLVTYAWGGMTEPEEGSALAETIVQLLEFVRGAMRAPRLEEAEAEREGVFVAAAYPELMAEAVSGGPQTLFEVESAIRELEAGSAEVRVYRALLQQRDGMLEVWREVEGAVPVKAGVAAVATAGSVASGALVRLVRQDDPWDENSELQQELRRFAAHRERMLTRAAERAARPLSAKLLGEAESVLGHWLGGSWPGRRGLGLRSH